LCGVTVLCYKEGVNMPKNSFCESY